jgi:hypothetical protein
MDKTRKIMKKFVLVLLVLAAAASASWETTVGTDPITDETIVLLKCRASSGTNSWGERPYLYVRFTDGEDIEIFIYWDTYVGSANLSCIVRIDDAEAQTYRVNASTSSKHTFFQGISNQEKLFIEMLDGTEFVCRFTPYGENTITATFSLHGFTSAALGGDIDLDSYRNRVEEVLEEESTIFYQDGAISIGEEILYHGEAHTLLEIRRGYGSSEFSRIRIVPTSEYNENGNAEGYWVTRNQLNNTVDQLNNQEEPINQWYGLKDSGTIHEEPTVSYQDSTLSIGEEILYHGEVHTILEIVRTYRYSRILRVRMVSTSEYNNDESVEGYWVTTSQLNQDGN